MTRYTVVITERAEADSLASTVANIKDTQKNVTEILHISDQHGRGPSRARHEGLTRAENEIVIICDAHMRFMPGALDAQASYQEANRNTISCLVCHHNDSMEFSLPGYLGASLHWKFTESGVNQNILVAKWRTHGDLGEIPCLLGACYGINRSFYKKIGSPWMMGIGWGACEETVSIAARLVGGSVVILPSRCAHEYHSSFPVRPAASPDNYGIWYNYLRNLHFLPLGDSSRMDLTEHLFKNPAALYYRNIVEALIIKNKEIINACADTLKKNQVISFDEYARKWIIGYPG